MDVQTTRIVPDGGYGWIIVAAVAVINMTNQSILSVFGQLFVGELRRMQEDTFTAALITNLNSLALNFSGLFIGPAIKSFKPRNVAACGCLLVSFGLVLCSFATQTWHFIVGYSGFVGFGLGLISPSTFMAINSYFTTKRGRAVGVSLAGAGVGQVFIPHVVRYFMVNHGFRGAVLAMASLSLTGVFGALFLKPLTPAPAKHNNRKHMQLLVDKQDKSQSSITIQPLQSTPTPTKTAETLCGKMAHRLAQAMDLELLKDLVFWSIIVGMALVYTATINFTMVFPSFLQHTAQLDSQLVATCMSVVAGADIICRLLLPCITDRLRIPYRVVFLLGTAGLLFGRLLLAGSTNLGVIISMSVLIGMTKSATVINNNLTISAHCRADKLAGGLGLSMISKGIIVITVGQLLGWIRDYADSYVICLYAQAVLLLLVVLLWTPEIYYRFRKQQQHNTSKSMETTYMSPEQASSNSRA
ncbi:monocarboxylate transporter 13 [Drosophila nasuta]|uniref:monocarboxylate transporter 13 n=1 Tax=Drosophila nasuta TaxID=42062 RepID=UPI00295F1608|nr:monocarboxylate transporter 13 [Drosophila nasuta]XP_060658991.1 monocarboxylate transporter 13 [Drosophila nasuta]